MTSFTIDSTSLGVTDWLGGLVAGSDLQGLNPFPLAPPEDYPLTLGWDSSNVYWIDSVPNQSQDAVVRRVPR